MGSWQVQDAKARRWTSAGATPARELTVRHGRPFAIERDERTISIGPAGVMAMACTHRRPEATREAPNGDHNKDQLATRESQAGGGEARSTNNEAG